ncbi:hypothetical protein BASA50_003512 [Batrachochytrium salamandrivorans]|uniref:Uncharacterized protein n=1 Tax=Batrachochytrium salamandrivorans TaxID=1357716 RepID=A0ABQ8FHM8_9FUNG|nr:hypothetical protein BASA62_003827 [Batrachochytrium salamandrivorans]KAH6572150.1 hypothetical protein BASA60_006762 [Batrachochytrium salamandrivorans]KAH6598472.1 hypothetical protein BASA50_003512 [Batrachochytrium salamandrivorans]KAH6599123.1 hypothetical protein BASA61_002654 [Batrachochytrium salamandrivorans]KAH9251647.1 hypothetical protein BASA81_010488 [Batrachochytrium salamandrivorans]
MSADSTSAAESASVASVSTTGTTLPIHAGSLSGTANSRLDPLSSRRWRSASTDQAIAGFTAGAISSAVLHPLDLVKTRFQVNEKFKARLSLIDSLKSISKQSGTRALYRGLSANMAGATVSWGLYFWWYSNIKDWMRASSPDRKTSKLAPSQHLMASASAGMLTCLLANPLWLIKTRMCTQKATDPGAYRHVIDGLVQVVRHEGVSGLYRGIVPALVGVSHGALQFMVYEEMKHLRTNIVHSADMDKLNTLEYICMAATSKVFATIFTYPYQVVKSRMQVQSSYVSTLYSGTIGTVTQIARNEGMGGFYKGMGVNIVRVLPGTCITFAVYEGMSKFLRSS